MNNSATIGYISTLLLGIFVVVGFYQGAKTLLMKLAGVLSKKIRARMHSTLEVRGVLELLLIVGAHLVFACVLVYFTDSFVTLRFFTFGQVVPLIVLGFFLGLGEMALSMFIVQVFLAVSLLFQERASGKPLRLVARDALVSPGSSLMSASRGGWIQHHLAVLRVLPYGVAVLLPLLQVTCEELVFRTVLVSEFLPFGTLIAVLSSGLLFVVMQAFLMPNFRSALFPMSGAAVMAIVHGILYIQTGEIVPLIVAHATFFLIAML